MNQDNIKKSDNTKLSYEDMALKIVTFLDEQKAENIVQIDLRGKASFADGMIVVSGISQRHLKALSEKLKQFLHESGVSRVHIEGAMVCEWVLVDAGDIIIHLFRPEVRDFYSIEKMWMKNN